MNHNHIHAGIIVLTLITAVVHCVIGYSDSDHLLTLNGLGYIALLIALYIPFTPLQNYRTWFRNTLMIYTIVTIVGYFALHRGIPTVHAHGGEELADSVVEETVYESEELGGDSSELNSAGSQPAKTEVMAEGTKKPDYMGLSVKGIEVLLLGLLVADGIVDRKAKKREQSEIPSPA